MNSRKGSVKTWVIFIVLILIAFGLLYYFQQIRKPAEEEPAPPAPTVKEEPAPVPKKPRKEFAVDELTEAEKKEVDYESLNIAMQSGEGCENIKFDPELRQQCEDQLLLDDALRRGNENLCNQIENEVLRTQCLDQIYLSRATQEFDAELCKKIIDEALKQSCFDRLQSVLGRMAASAESCDVIKDPILKQSCLDNYYFSSSIDSLDTESCENIKDSSLKERCSKTIEKNIEVVQMTQQAITREYKTTAEKLEICTTDSCKDEANYDLAYEKKDLSYCNLIIDSQKQSECIRVQSANINSYYMKKATSKKDVSLCNKITDQSLRTSCIDIVK